MLTASAVLPLAIMAGAGLYVLLRQQYAQTERIGLELSRSVANAVDGELRSTIAVAETLATSPTLDRDDTAGFRERADRILKLRPFWSAVLVSAPDGRLLMDTRSGPGAPVEPILDRASFDTAVRTQTATTGDLVRGPSGEWFFAVRVPVLRGGRVLNVVSVLITPEAIRRVVARQDLPSDWVISIVDSKGLRLARSRAHDANLGGRLSPTAQALVDRAGAEGFGLSYTLEGERIFTPYTRLANGWLAVLGLPTTLVDAAAYRALATYGGGIVLSILLGALGALWVAGTITQPMAELRSAARAMGRREPPKPPATPIQEIRDVGAALTTAAADLARGEAERDDLLRKERLAREAAESADRAKDEFLALLSHELRTPLNAVYGWAKMLQTGQIDGQAVDRAKDAIVRNAEIQKQLIDDLLDVSRIITGKLRLDIATVDPREVLQAAVDAVRPAADAKHIRVQTCVDGDVRTMRADAARLQQVFWNLLVNAVKFTPAGGAVDVRIENDAAAAALRIVVRDTGQGIPADVLPYIFERFRQADSSTTRPHGGLGLGLALVKHLVELHGGTVTAESAGANCGATFTVSMPAPPYADSHAQNRPPMDSVNVSMLPPPSV